MCKIYRKVFKIKKNTSQSIVYLALLRFRLDK